MNKRLSEMLKETQMGGVKQTCLLDTYNKAIYTDFAPTISTRVDASSNTFIMEQNRVKVMGKCWESSQNGLVYDPNGLSPTIVCGSHSGVEPKIGVVPLNPYKDGTARTIKAQYHQSSMANFKRQDGLGATGVLMIPQATKQGYIEVEQGGVFYAAYPESTTRRGRVQDGGKVTPTICTSNELSLYEGVKNGEFRIRKLTPRECFRLMGVSEENIGKIQAAGISNSQQYKMAGNSIVVDTLYHIFKKMFIDKENENNQLTLF